MVIKELGDYTMLLEDDTAKAWGAAPENIADFLCRTQLKNNVIAIDDDNLLSTCDYIVSKDMENLNAKGIIVLYFKDKISDKYTVNQHINVNII